jgi:hypothetical protein
MRGFSSILRIDFGPGQGAQLIRSRLDAAGIETEVDPEFDPLSVGGFSTNAGGIRVKVSPERAEEAKAIIAAGERAE